MIITKYQEELQNLYNDISFFKHQIPDILERAFQIVLNKVRYSDILNFPELYVVISYLPNSNGGWNQIKQMNPNVRYDDAGYELYELIFDNENDDNNNEIDEIGISLRRDGLAEILRKYCEEWRKESDHFNLEGFS